MNDGAILLVADEPLRGAVRRALQAAGHREVLDAAPAGSAPDMGPRPAVAVVDLDGGADVETLLAGLTTDHPPPTVIALTAALTPDTRARGAALGAHDFARRPIDDGELALRVQNALEHHRLARELAEREHQLEHAIRERSDGLDTAHESLTVLAAIADYHDDDTDQHAQRVGIAAALIARALELPKPFVTMIRHAAPLHDIGKVGISRRILLKPGKLTPAERMHMMRHVDIGAEILGAAHSPVLQLAAEVARSHHERFNGDGYLAGLAGTDIPISGRITAVADVWDTLTHERPYRAAWDEDRALAELHDQAGQHFDPDVIAAFMSIDRRMLASAPSAAARAA